MDVKAQHRLRAEFVWLVDEEAVFIYGRNSDFFNLDGEVWEEMGRPRVIAITVERDG